MCFVSIWKVGLDAMSKIAWLSQWGLFDNQGPKKENQSLCILFIHEKSDLVQYVRLVNYALLPFQKTIW